MDKLIQLILQNKGTRSYRTVLFLAVGYIAWQVTKLEQRIAIIEYRLAVTHQAVSDSPVGRSSGAVTTGPEWPKHVADALRLEK